MRITSAALEQRLPGYVGGQFEIQNPNENYLYRGEIESVKVEDGDLKVKFAWLGKSTFPPTGEWVRDNQLDYATSLDPMMQVSIEERDNNRISVMSPIVGELGIIFPPGASSFSQAILKDAE